MLDEICREGSPENARGRPRGQLEASLAEARGERDAEPDALVTRSGQARERCVQTVAGAGAIRVPDLRVEQTTGEKRKFSSAIVPPWCRRSPKVTEVLPLLYLHELSTGDFAPALETFFGSSIGLSSSVITRLRTSRQDATGRWSTVTSETLTTSISGQIESR